MPTGTINRVKAKGYETSLGLVEEEGTKGMTVHKILECVVPESKSRI
jgi:hypothetical protein